MYIIQILVVLNISEKRFDYETIPKRKRFQFLKKGPDPPHPPLLIGPLSYIIFIISAFSIRLAAPPTPPHPKQPNANYPGLGENTNSAYQIDINRYPWISMDIDGYQWISMDINGYRWISMDINGYRWISMKINENQ